MTCLFNVAPFDGGWCVKIDATGEVLFFSARRRAIAEAHVLARAWPASAEVRIHSRAAETRSFETWDEDALAPEQLAVRSEPNRSASSAPGGSDRSMTGSSGS